MDRNIALVLDLARAEIETRRSIDSSDEAEGLLRQLEETEQQIIAAPDLLAALEKLVRHEALESSRHEYEHSADNCRRTDPVYFAARAAIAKAKGA